MRARNLDERSMSGVFRRYRFRLKRSVDRASTQRCFETGRCGWCTVHLERG